MENDIKKWLDDRSGQEGVPMTELVRRALRQFREQEERSVNRVLTETSGIQAGVDGLEFQRAIRDEWGK
jgi:hypothetical protein